MGPNRVLGYPAASAYGIVELGVDSSFWWSTPLMRTAELAEEEHYITLVFLLIGHYIIFHVFGFLTGTDWLNEGIGIHL